MSTKADNTKLPSHFHIGLQRSGSTFLYNLFARHPQVSLSSFKEVNFYTSNFDKGFDWYIETFDNKELKIDTSVKYFMKGSIAAERIKAALQNKKPKFLLIMRNPVDYVYSHYQVQLLSGYLKQHPEIYPKLPKQFMDFIKMYPDYIERGMYAKILQKHWMPLFDLSCFKFVCFEEFISNTNKVLQEIFQFFQLDYLKVNTVSTSKHKQLNYPFLYSISALLSKMPTIKRFLKNSTMINRIYDKFLTSRPAKLDAKERLNFSKLFRQDVARLKEITKLEFCPWKELYS